MSNVIPIPRVSPVSDELVEFQIHIGRLLHREVAKAAKKGTFVQLSPEGLMSILLLSAASVASNIVCEEHGPTRINIGAAFGSARDCIINAN
jgi:hypothetical protein